MQSFIVTLSVKSFSHWLSTIIFDFHFISEKNWSTQSKFRLTRRALLHIGYLHSNAVWYNNWKLWIYKFRQWKWRIINYKWGATNFLSTNYEFHFSKIFENFFLSQNDEHGYEFLTLSITRTADGLKIVFWTNNLLHWDWFQH